MSFGVLVAACAYLLGDWLWSIGDNILFLLGCLVLSFVVDQLISGATTQPGVYIEPDL